MRNTGSPPPLAAAYASDAAAAAHLGACHMAEPQLGQNRVHGCLDLGSVGAMQPAGAMVRAGRKVWAYHGMQCLNAASTPCLSHASAGQLRFGFVRCHMPGTRLPVGKHSQPHLSTAEYRTHSSTVRVGSSVSSWATYAI